MPALRDGKKTSPPTSVNTSSLLNTVIQHNLSPTHVSAVRNEAIGTQVEQHSMDVPGGQNYNETQDMRDDLKAIRILIEGLKTSMETHRNYVDNKILELTTSFQLSCSENFRKCQVEIANIQGYVDAEIGRVVTRMDELEQKVNKLDFKEEFEPDVSVIATGINFTQNEDIDDIAKKLVRQGLGLREEECKVVRAKRMPQRNDQRGQRKPPLVKIELQSTTEKIKALRAKRNLKNFPEWERVFIRSSKPHVERLIELNFKTLLGMVDGGDNWKITGSGRIVKKDD